MEIDVSFEVEGSKEEIWSRLVKGGGLKEWLGAEELKMDLFAEGTFALNLKLGGSDIEISGETALLLPPEKIGLTWMEQERGRDLWTVPTTVIFAIEDGDKTSRITVTHSGFKHLPDEFAEEAYSRYKKFWRNPKMAERLNRVIKVVELENSGGRTSS